MITIDPKILEKMPPFDPRISELYHTIQEEICHVIESSGATLSASNNHQMSDVIAQFALESPQRFTLDFDPPSDPSGITKTLGSFQFDPSKYFGASFRYTLLSKQTNGTYAVILSDVVRLSYQTTPGVWSSALNLDSDPHTVIGSDGHSVILLPSVPMAGPSDFSMTISPTGFISVTSSDVEILKPTRLIFSHFQFVRRPNHV